MKLMKNALPVLSVSIGLFLLGACKSTKTAIHKNFGVTNCIEQKLVIVQGDTISKYDVYKYYDCCKQDFRTTLADSTRRKKYVRCSSNLAMPSRCEEMINIINGDLDTASQISVQSLVDSIKIWGDKAKLPSGISYTGFPVGGVAYFSLSNENWTDFSDSTVLALMDEPTLFDEFDGMTIDLMFDPLEIGIDNFGMIVNDGLPECETRELKRDTVYNHFMKNYKYGKQLYQQAKGCEHKGMPPSETIYNRMQRLEKAKGVVDEFMDLTCEGLQEESTDPNETPSSEPVETVEIEFPCGLYGEVLRCNDNPFEYNIIGPNGTLLTSGSKLAGEELNIRNELKIRNAASGIYYITVTIVIQGASDQHTYPYSHTQ